MLARRLRRDPLGKVASFINTEFDPRSIPYDRQMEIMDLKLRERSSQEANAVGDFVSNRIQSVEDLNSNALKMRLYQMAVEHFRDKLPAGMIRMFVDAALQSEMAERRKQAAAKRALAEAASKKTEAVVS